MNFKELFENAVLSDETKEIVQEAFDLAVQAKEQELAEQFEAKLIEEKAELTNSMVQLVEEAVTEELEAIKEEIVHARTLEVQYADKLQEFKESYAEAQEDRAQVLIAEAIADEIGELREDIEMAKKYEFTMQMFEAFRGTYERLFGESDVNVHDELDSLREEVDSLRREKKLAELLEGLEGRQRTIAKTILESVSTDKLEEKFESIHGVLIAESKKSTGVITESAGVKGTIVLENEDPEEDDEDKDEDEDDKIVEKKGKKKKVTESVDPLIARLEKSLQWAR